MDRSVVQYHPCLPGTGTAYFILFMNSSTMILVVGRRRGVPRQHTRTVQYVVLVSAIRCIVEIVLERTGRETGCGDRVRSLVVQ